MKFLSRQSTSYPLQITTLWSGSVLVPIDFVGVHIHKWPAGSPMSPAPTYKFGAWRSHDYGPAPATTGVRWAEINTSNGVYDWSGLDLAINTHYAAGRSIYYQIYQCPTWAARVAWQSTPDAYNYNGGGSPPNSLTSLSDFVTALVTRYTPKIKFLSTWNEASYAQDGTGFFWGSAADLAAMARAVKIAARAVDGAIVLASPDFTGTANVAPFLNASDGAAGFGRQHVDLIAYHPYTSYGWYDRKQSINMELAVVDTALRAQIVVGGLSAGTPVYGTEIGYASSPSDPKLLASTPGNLAAWIKRLALRAAALSWKSVYFYSHDSAYSGNPSINYECSTALNFIHGLLAGRTLTLVQQQGRDLIVTTDSGRTVLPSIVTL